MKPSFRRSPGNKGSDIQTEAQFVAAAGQPVVAATLPWVGLDDEKSRELYNLRLTEAEKAKLAFIVENTKFKSMQEYCMHVLRPAIEAEIARLTGTGQG